MRNGFLNHGKRMVFTRTSKAMHPGFCAQRMLLAVHARTVACGGETYRAQARAGDPFCAVKLLLASDFISTWSQHVHANTPSYQLPYELDECERR